MSNSQQIDKTDDTRLYRVFYKGFPQFHTERNGLDVPALSKAIGISREGLYKWLRGDYVPPKRATRLIALSAKGFKGNENSPRILTQEKLARFVFNY